MGKVFSVAVVGCGSIGSRRATVAAEHGASQTVLVIDSDLEAARRVADATGSRAATDWREVLDGEIDVVVISTPNGLLAEIGVAALAAGRHVLLEKPMGRNLAEAERLAAAAERAGRLLKIGFNHRYHPAIAGAYERLAAGAIGDPINVRARYGHGGRPGYEREWRGDAELAGGGELTDQGVHVFDLLQWFIGAPESVYCLTQTAVWPLTELEDNGFALLRYARAIASVHTSWTQWKNLFSFEVFGTHGSLVVEGLGKSYGPERLTIATRRPDGGPPEEEELVFPGPDLSWEREWIDFVSAIDSGSPYLGTPEDGIAAMRVLDACYRSNASGTAVRLHAERTASDAETTG